MSKRTLHRLISLLAALVMAVSLLTGCGTKTAEQVQQEPVLIASTAQSECPCSSSFRSVWISVRHCSSSGLNAPHSPFRIICTAFSWG